MATAPKTPAEAEPSTKVGISMSFPVNPWSLIAVLIQLMLINMVNL